MIKRKREQPVGEEVRKTKAEERVREIQACCDTIKRLAGKIINFDDMNIQYDINIHIEPKQLPVIEVKTLLVSKEMLEAVQDNE
ncbi:hypothetical protein [Parablautia muri]|uniref:Uncharacterized protein n=1 Tax=Parablautia muri TaxID=2320879 RepID=A0A9X5BFR3_9FIRM|nr:hypothetical protein [Parablautia muri]NBJ93214.1 hypothetical protein [Parablautia muri]